MPRNSSKAPRLFTAIVDGFFGMAVIFCLQGCAAGVSTESLNRFNQALADRNQRQEAESRRELERERLRLDAERRKSELELRRQEIELERARVDTALLGVAAIAYQQAMSASMSSLTKMTDALNLARRNCPQCDGRALLNRIPLAVFQDARNAQVALKLSIANMRSVLPVDGASELKAQLATQDSMASDSIKLCDEFIRLR